ncbi:MAG: LytR/AlgR family response regulator transcription factor [Bacteroidia bacterium]
MRAIIIDDEKKSRSILATMLLRYCSTIKLVGEAGNIRDAHQLIMKHEPDLVFLDISMPEGSGFELLNRLKEISFQIIFVTAFDEYAIQAIRNDALDYLVKPVSIEELRSAVKRAEQKQNMSGAMDNFHHINEMMRQGAETKRIAIPENGGLLFLALKDIIRLEADGSYTRFHLISGKSVLSSRHLKEYDTHLPGDLFFRVHHSHVINLDHIHHYERGEGGTIVMSDHSSVSLSKRKKKAFLERFRIES